MKSLKIGVPRIELGLHPPHGRVLPAYSTPSYFILAIFLMHFVQALILLPLAKVVHCKFGYFLVLLVGLYLLRSFFRVTLIIDVFSQREQILDIK